ncbi:lipopolysaccharide biosynthesis protein [Paractinoplanes rishiriensis]|uniref:Polysaccharide biosynthesis protein n=1 Tax=Paractinoplanes rishiriensis TaxID=1050105 RepID=A0A919MRC6_9ACTN|nr:oligosaccharide flippase family protein [Actinoplanes rishiriensis]GIE97071.1 hypothetical protein Ari01nite_45360 [Actinoplanes rishiriensis]
MTAVLAPAPARAGWLLVATTTAGIVNYAYAVVLTHGLDPAQYATFAAGQALIVVAGAVCGAGIPWVVARELARNPGDHERHAVVVTFGMWAGLLVGAVLALLLAGAELVLGTAREAAVVGLACVLLAAGSTVLGYLQGRGRMAAIAGLLTAETLVKFGVGAALVFGTSLGAAGALLGFVAGGLVLLLPLPAVRHLLRRPVWRADESALWRAAVHQTRLKVTVAVAGAGDTVLVALLGLGGRGGGPYQAASALGRVPMFASNAICTAAFPHLARDPAAAHRAAALRSYLLIGLLMAGALGTLPDQIRALLFPASFDDVGRWLPWTAMLGLAIGALNLGVTFLQAADPSGRSAGALAGITLAYLAVVAATGAAFAVGGLAAGAAAGGLLSVGALTLFPAVRGGAAHLLRSWRTRRELAGVLLAVLALALTEHVVLWLLIAAAAGFVVVRAAFPDLLPSRRPS